MRLSMGTANQEPEALPKMREMVDTEAKERKPMSATVYETDCIAWMKSCAPNKFEAIITDPPYGMREYTRIEVEKMRKGIGGVWRIPPKIGGHERKPLPRFTVLTEQDIGKLQDFLLGWGRLAHKILVPGGHLVIASNPLLIYAVTSSLTKAGFENRGIIVRTVRTLKAAFAPSWQRGNSRRFPAYLGVAGNLGVYSGSHSGGGFRRT